MSESHYFRALNVEYFVGSLNGYCYTSVYTGCSGSTIADANGIIHMRRLLASETVKDTSGNPEARTDVEYDNYVADGGFHAAIVPNQNMIQYNGARSDYWNDSLYDPRGNSTQITRWISGTSPEPVVNSVTYAQYDNAGNVVKTIDPRSTAVNIIATAISYADNFGDGSNPDSGVDGTNGKTFAMPTLITNALSQSVKTQYNYTRGVATGIKDANLVITQTEYNDPYDRPTKVTAALGFGEQTITEMSYPSFANNQLVNESKMSKQLDSTNWLTSRTQFDGFGRPVLSSSAEDGKKFTNSPSYTIHSSTIYDGLGHPWKMSNPYRSTSAATNGWTRTTYDQLGRVTEVASFGADPSNTPPPNTGTTGSTDYSGSVTTSYASEVTTVTDQAGKIRRSTIDGLGRLIKVEEMLNASTVYATTTYDYDARGNLRQVNQTNNSVAQTRRFAYDNMSRLIFAANPEQETSTDATFTYNSQNWAVKYVYDAASNLKDKFDTRQVSSVFVKVHYDYDALNRVTQRTYTDGTPSTPQVNYVYDTATKGVGRLASVEADGVSKYNYLVYDSLGRVTSSRQDTSSQNYAMGYGYNKAGLMTDETYPSTKVIHTDYDVAGRIAGVKKTGSTSYYAGAGSTDTNRMQYTAHGAVNTMLLGNTLWEHTTFNSRLQPEQIGLGTLSTNSSVLQLDYTYGVSATTNNGNIASQTITAPNVSGPNVSMAQSYTYDQVNRLKTFAEADGWSQTYNYDQAGNRWVSAGYIPTLSQTPQTQSSFVAGTNRMNPSVMLGSGYDKAGNQTSMANAVSGTDLMAYDAESHQKSYTKSGQAANSYFYDGDGRRVKRIDTGNNATTVFVYNVAGQLIAEYQTDPMAPVSGGGGTSYLTSDHLGSTRVVTNSSAAVKARYDYLPFGEEMGAGVGLRSTAMGYSLGDSTRQKFTQKERDSESGLDYFLARYYSSAQGRFTSCDEFVGGPDELFDFSGAASSNPTFYADLTDPQSLNKYQYCYNNPLLYIDPDGHQGIKKWIQDTLRGAAATFNADNGLPGPSGDQTTTGRVIGHGAAILQGVTEVVTGGNMIAGGGTEAVVTSPAATTVVGAVVPAAGVGVAIGGAALVVHGGAVLINTAKNIVNEKSSTGPSAENSPGVSSSGQATDQHGNKLGPSGKPMVNTTRSTTREAARSKALNEGSRAVEHRNPKRGERHFHPADAAGKKKPSSTHHEY